MGQYYFSCCSAGPLSADDKERILCGAAQHGQINKGTTIERLIYLTKCKFKPDIEVGSYSCLKCENNNGVTHRQSADCNLVEKTLGDKPKK